MGSVAERFVFGRAAAAERHAVADLDGFAVRALYGNVAGDPERPIGDHGDAFGQIRLIGFAGGRDLISERPGRAALDHGDDLRTDGDVVSFFSHLPDVGDLVLAEGREGADRPVVLYGDFRAG